MAGNYDDLIPKTAPATAAAPAAAPGAYDDLIPGSPPVTPTANLTPSVGARGAALSGRQVVDMMPVYPQGTDTQSGAPVNVRMLVGSAPPRDRLANLQKFFPDAKVVPNRYGEPTDHFVYTDPSTGKLTAYNPAGIELGDVASIGREATQGVGATLGGAAGLIEALPTAEIASPATVPVMAGVGATTADNIYSALMQSLGRQVDSRTVGEHALDDLYLTGTTALGSGVGDAVGTVGRATTKDLGNWAMLGEGGAQRIANMDAAGVTPSVTTATTRTPVRILANALNISPTGSSTMTNLAQRNLNEIAPQIHDVASQFAAGRPMDQTMAGKALQRGAMTTADQTPARISAMYDNAYARIGANTPVPLTETGKLYAEIASKTAGAEDAMSGTVTGMNRIADVIRASLDPVTGQARPVSFAQMRNIRSEIGRELETKPISGSNGPADDVKQALYRALTADLNTVAARDPQGNAILQQANKLKAFYENSTKPVLQDMVKTPDPEALFRTAMAGSQDGGTALARIRGRVPREDWDTLAGTVLDRMGMAPANKQNAASNVFSANTFLTNWADNRLSPGAKNALFGGTRYAALRPQLDRLIQTMDYMKGVDRFANPSGTARLLMFGQALASVGGLVSHPTLGSLAAAGAAATVPWATAKYLMTSPVFVRWLVSTSEATPNGISSQIGRLSAIGRANPDISQPIEDYIKVLQQNTGQAQQPTPTRPVPVVR